MLTSEMIRKIRRIEIRTSRVVQEAVAGRYLSAFKGRGMEFEEVRPYEIGDDIRTIDWNVSARAGSPHVKLFREERELTVVLAVDLSGSLSFGSRTRLKRELVAEVAATLAFSATRNNDKVGLLLFSDRIERHVPPRKGRRHVLRIVRELLAHTPEGRGTAIASALDELNRIQKRRAVVFVISDFLDAGWERPMAIAHSRHDVIPVRIDDPLERELPSVGLVEMEDQETGELVTVDTGSRRVREAYKRQGDMRALQFELALRRMRIEPICVQTGCDPIGPITAYFRRREARRSR
ncbi:MAG: DUF58 domain-containing protein [Phycisphaerales bacterium]|nr:DUF58 domain-containing protein [Phycisphaerales bacterium]